jgi:hypothetical protein
MYEPLERKSGGKEAPLPAQLRAGLETLGGQDLSGVRVHHDSPLPASVGALAYTQGKNIHLAPGQEKHLAHEGWHAVQQMAGRVTATTSVAGVPVNDHASLEGEADTMGARAMSAGVSSHALQRLADETLQAAGGTEEEEEAKQGLGGA